MKASTERFSDRVRQYARYRPAYPAAALDLLQREFGLAGRRVADIGAGTGIFSAALLERGARVAAVEPNREMREAAEHRLGGRAEGFTSHAGTAEASGLAAASVDLVVAAQAFHWFDRDRARREFRRILVPGGGVALLWNERVLDTTAFLRGYERLLRDHAPEYGVVDHRDIGADAVAAFFAPGPVSLGEFVNRLDLDYAGLEGRLLSSSYAPLPGHPRHEPMLTELRRLFQRCEIDGRVTMEYRTRVFYGRLEA